MTTTANKTIAGALDQADPNMLADLLRLVKLGTLLTPVKQTISQSSAVTVTLDPPALSVTTLRVTGGTVTSGIYQVADEAATEVDSATLGVASLNDEGDTLTFAAAITDLIVQYIPRSYTDVTGDFPGTGVG